ncbi:MAG: hypothetical protein ACPL7B_14385 [Candidatus Poribacteria bacterium]
MPAPTKIYFAQIASAEWKDWVQVINVDNDVANIMAIARNEKGETVWSGERRLRPFQAWSIPIDPVSVKQELSLTVSSNRGIVGERHCHYQTQVLAFPGAAPELKNVGRRLFFPEIRPKTGEWFRILNIDINPAMVNIIVRDTNGVPVKQFSSPQINPQCFWSFVDAEVGDVYGTMEMISTQTIVSERHLHYGEDIKGVAVGMLGQPLDVSPIPNKIYFAQIAAGAWGDWVKVINVSNEEAKLVAVARDQNGQTVWTNEKSLRPYADWVVPIDSVASKQDLSLTVMSNKQIVGERHCHLRTEVLPFPGAAPEIGTAGRRLFFPELIAGSYDFFRMLNITDQTAFVNAIVRNIEGRVVKQIAGQIPPFGYWTLRDEDTANTQGTLEIMSTQTVVGERHLHYGQQYHPGVAIGQLGQVLD